MVTTSPLYGSTPHEGSVAHVRTTPRVRKVRHTGRGGSGTVTVYVPPKKPQHRQCRTCRATRSRTANARKVSS